MLFTEFAQKLAFCDDFARAVRGSETELPRVSNAAKKVDIALRYAINDFFQQPDSKKKLLDVCGLTRPPEDISYYLVDTVRMTADEDWYHIRWAARIGEQDVDIAVFKLLTKNVDLCGQTLVFVEGAEFESGLADNLADAIVAAVRLHEKAGHSLFERWCFGSYDWRCHHLICPACGSQIGAYCSDGHVVTGCNHCDWEPSKKYRYESDLASVENMEAELKKYKKRRQRIERHDNLYDKMMPEIKAFITAATHESPNNETFYRYIRSLNEAIQELQKAADQMDIKKCNKK